MKKQKGQVTIFLTLMAMGLMTIGIFVGTWAVKHPSSPFHIKASTICACGPWEDGGCGGGQCPSNKRYQRRNCSPDGCDEQDRCVTDDNCSASLTHKICLAYCSCRIGEKCDDCTYMCKVVKGEGEDQCTVNEDCISIPEPTNTPVPTTTPTPTLPPSSPTPTPTPEQTAYIQGNVTINNPDRVSLSRIRVRGHHIINGTFEPIIPVQLPLVTGGPYEIPNLIAGDQYLLRAEAFRSPDDVLVGSSDWKSPIAPAVGVNFIVRINSGIFKRPR